MNSATLASTPSVYGSMPSSSSHLLQASFGHDATSGVPGPAPSHRTDMPAARVGGPAPSGLGPDGENSDGARVGARVGEAVDGADDVPTLDIFINNVVCSFGVRCHLNLRKIGQLGSNVEYRREFGKVNMRFRTPPATATIWSSGKITITGNDSEFNAKKSARKCARALQKMGFHVRFSNYKIVNVLGTSSMPFAIRIRDFSEQHPRNASYEPELHPAVTYKLYSPRATLKIFSTGSITVTAPSIDNINAAIQHIYPLLEPHKMPLSEETIQKRLSRKRAAENKGETKPPRRRKTAVDESDDDEEDDEDEDEVDEDDDEDREENLDSDEEYTDEDLANEGLCVEEDSEDDSVDD